MRIAKIENALGIGIVIGKYRGCTKGKIRTSGKQHSIEAGRRQLEACRCVFLLLGWLVAGKGLHRGLQRILIGKLRRSEGDKILRCDAELCEPFSGVTRQALAKGVRGGDDPHLVPSTGKSVAEKQINLLFGHITQKPASPVSDLGIVGQRQHRNAGVGSDLARRHHRIGKERADNDVGFGLDSFACRDAGTFLGCIEYQKLYLPVAKREQRQLGTALQFTAKDIIRARCWHKQRDPHDPGCLFRHQEAFLRKALFTPCQHRKGRFECLTGK